MIALKSIKDNKKRILFAFVIVLIAHAVKIINYLPTHDSMYGLSLSYTEMIDQGRWLGPLVSNLLTTRYDLQWVEGIVSALFIALTIHLIMEIFPLHNLKNEATAIMLFIVFPSIAGCFIYEFWCAAVFFSLLLAILAIYIIIESNSSKCIIFATILLLISLGIYQLFVIVSATTILFWASYTLMKKQKTFREIVYKILLFSISAICSLILYWIISRVTLAAFGLKITQYQGMNSIGIMSLHEYINAFVSFIKSFILFFIPIDTFTIYGCLNGLLGIVLVILVFVKVLLNDEYNVIEKTMIVLFPVLGIVANYILYFVSKGVSYHVIMEIGNYFVYLFVIILASKKNEECASSFIRRISYVPILLVILITFCNFQNNNIAYKQQEIRYSRTNFEVTEILTWIDEINEENISKIAIFGQFEKNNNVAKPMLSIVGARSDTFLTHPYHFVRFAEFYYGRTYIECSEEEINAIRKTDEYTNMQSYPNKSCVAIINNCLVLKLTE